MLSADLAGLAERLRRASEPGVGGGTGISAGECGHLARVLAGWAADAGAMEAVGLGEALPSNVVPIGAGRRGEDADA